LNTNNKLVTKYHKADYNSMRDWLKCIDWAMECSDLTIDEMLLKFCSINDRAINIFVPLGQDRNMKIPSWMNKSANSEGNINLQCGIDIGILKVIMI